MSYFFALEVMEISKLTLKQQRFADEYIISGNATAAAIKAGYSKKTARSIGQENLTKPDVKSYIDKRLAELKADKIADQTEVLEFLTAAMRGEVTEPILKNSGDFEQVIVEVKPSVATRKQAAELLGKRFGLWIDRREVEHTGEVTFIDDIS